MAGDLNEEELLPWASLRDLPLTGVRSGVELLGGSCQAAYLVARCRPHQLGLRQHQPRGVQLPSGPLGGQRWTVHIDAQGSLLLALSMHHMEKEEAAH